MKWTTLRGLGNVQALKASYVVIAVLPFVARTTEFTRWIGLTGGWLLAASYFSAVFLACGVFLYEVFCPDILKRFQTEEDYKSWITQLNDRAVRSQAVLAGIESLRGSSGHEFKLDTKLREAQATAEQQLQLELETRAEATFQDALGRHSPWRWLCSVCFSLGGLGSLALLLNRSYRVMKSISGDPTALERCEVSLPSMLDLDPSSVTEFCIQVFALTG